MIPLLFSKAVYAKRRAKILAELDPQQDLLILFTAPNYKKNNDAHHAHVPDSMFYYLTGYSESDSAALLWKEKSKPVFEILVQPRDIAKEQWNGFLYGEDGARALLGADAAAPIAQLEQEILKWLSTVPRPGRAPRIFSNAFEHPQHREWLERVVARYEPEHRSGRLPVASLHDIRPLVGKLRLLKDAGELEVMREAGRVNVRAHLAAMHQVRPGMAEYEVQALIEYEFRKANMGTAYDSIVASGANAAILHYVENSRRMKKGEMLLIDAGCQNHFYASDITRTLPVGGKFEKRHRQLVEVVCEAQQAAIDVCRPGNRRSLIHEVAIEALVEGLRSLKLLSGSTRQIIEKLKYRKYYMHGTSHWLGIDTHDACPVVDDNGESLKLEPGMVLTVEPGLYFLPDDTSVAPAWRGLGVRIEDDVVVTEGDPEIITSGLPKWPDEVEAEMATARAAARASKKPSVPATETPAADLQV